MSVADSVARISEIYEGMKDDFKDIDGEQIQVGLLVHYAYDRDPEIWNQERWGIVTGLARTPRSRFHEEPEGFDLGVRVSSVNVSNDAYGHWNNGEWFCPPERLQVLK